MHPLTKELETWLAEFSRAVRARDFQSGSRLFDADVVSFGTACFRAAGLNELINRQWQAIWPVTRDFEFEYESALASVDTTQAVVVAGWRSIGLAEGSSFQRRGRATIILRRASADWKAVHTHFSLEPAPRHDPLPHQELLAAR